MNDKFSDFENGNGWNVTQPNNSWIMGAVLIAVGSGLLLRNLTGFEFGNWWALFMLIPLSGVLMKAKEEYQANGRINPGLMTAGLGMLFMATVFLFGLNLGALWPVFIIIGGISFLLGIRRVNSK